jgi:hypothetical protein
MIALFTDFAFQVFAVAVLLIALAVLIGCLVFVSELAGGIASFLFDMAFPPSPPPFTPIRRAVSGGFAAMDARAGEIQRRADRAANDETQRG